MGNEKLIIDIKPGGDVKIDVECVTGAQCQDLTKLIEERLGNVKSEELKDEFYQEESGTVKYEQQS